ncbi:hypothetical protein DXD68_03075 [Parabacteroides sp. TM07-1AC]|uniref:fimbrillin family protein n=1 Tax=Parabacteroides sp. TM07-1AC TaxID=2292363 RepID=UPI000EFED45D|nr:fimbrillin family protein [Parabacteroides sp. TM07-1AC]RHU21580.1 hypothetical protein DXD68_23805 [Parabacteroides sp. TM07-1AC]RHU30804.1 hypothetical protein DXD68_03075 [Parabacteroides sp. TM07-1AC]
MNKLIVITTFVCLRGLTACSDSNPTPPPVPETAICLEGAIGASTRGIIGSGYEQELKVSFARQDESAVSTDTYSGWAVHEAVRQGGRGNRPIVFAESQSYPEDGRHIRLHGYYPAEGEPTADAGTGKVTFRIDGTTDIMATGILEGNGFVPVTTCTFRHLLTQVRLVCYSDRADAWGTIQTIEAADVHTRQELDLSAETPRLADISVAEDIKNLPVQDIAGLLIPQVVSDGSSPEAQGYLLLPVFSVDGTAAHPLHLRITTTKDGNGNLKETISDVFIRIEGGFQIGKSHIVSLLFTGAGNIQAMHVSVEAWTEQEQGEMPI